MKSIFVLLIGFALGLMVARSDDAEVRLWAWIILVGGYWGWLLLGGAGKRSAGKEKGD